MKIADAESIKAGEQELITAIMEQLNSEIIESMASGKLSVKNLEFRNGDMIIHHGRIVYKMEFETSVSVSVMFDRDGNLVSDEDEEDAADVIPEPENDFGEPDKMFDEAVDDMSDAGNASVEDIMAELNTDSNNKPGQQDDDLNSILEKNRSFWLAQTVDSIEPVDTSGVESVDNELKDVLEKNRNFWVEQAESVTAGE